MSGPIDVFAIGGQSNAVGHGTGGPALTSGMCMHWWSGALAVRLGDPIGSTTGSAWPAFARKWATITGRPVCFVPAAVSGSSLLAAADTGAGNWSATGTLFDTLTDRVGLALSALESAGWQPVLRGLLWSQGEAEGVAINNATVTAGQYETALAALVDRWLAEFDGSAVFIIQTGTRDGVSDAPYAAVRTAQEAVCLVHGAAALVYRETVGFPALGWLVSGSDVHYSQAGLNDIGNRAAVAIASASCWQKAGLVAGSSAVDRRLSIGANYVNVTKAADVSDPENLGLCLNGGGLVLGAATRVYFGSAGAFLSAGAGSPQNVLVAPVGSIRLRTDGGAGSTFYVKESGTGSAGWVGK